MEKQKSRAVWPPEAGYFSVRLVRKGFRVPARIIHDGEKWQAEVDGEMQTPHPDPALAAMVADIWYGGRQIDQQEYDYLVAVKEHARVNNPQHPCLHPRCAIDHRVLTPIMPRGAQNVR